MWHGQKSLREQVVVITGATSGIGLATARLASERGAAVVLAARNERALRGLATELRRAGRRASYVVADVADLGDVRAIARAAIREHGRFDTWVNNAGVGVCGEVLAVPLEEQRRVFDVSFWGVVHGSRIAVDHFCERGGGTLVNVGSILSERAFPYMGVDSAAKHAVKAFTDALRMELRKRGAPVSVSLIKPSGVDTPFSQHARCRLAHEPRSRAVGAAGSSTTVLNAACSRGIPLPVYAPRVVARAILTCAEHARGEVTVGGYGEAFAWLEKLAPRLVDRALQHARRARVRRAPRREDTLEDAREGEERGREARRARRSSPYTALRLHPLRAMALGAVLIGLAVALRE